MCDPLHCLLMASQRIAIVTGSRFPHEDNDEEGLITALDARGVAATVQAWDDEKIDWHAFDAAVIRSTWDYSVNVDAFCQWAEETSTKTRLLNPANVVSWNADKRYLNELAKQGIPIVPTQYIASFDQWEVPDYEDYVIKPTVSGGGRNSGRFLHGLHDERATRLAREVLNPECRLLGTTLKHGRTLMVQPTMSSVESIGEKSLLFLGQKISHAIYKGQVLAPGGSRTPLATSWDNISATTWTSDELALAQEILTLIPGGPDQLAYARVDLVQDQAGMPRLLELEVLEPSLFLYTAPDSYGKFADALTQSLQT